MRGLIGASVLALLAAACGAGAEDRPRGTPSDQGAARQPEQLTVPPANPRPPAPTPPFDGARAWAHLQRQVDFGSRPAGSQALEQTRQYILAELKAAGIQAREQAFEAPTPAGPIRMVNIIATIPGRRGERIAVASHYDTKRTPFVGGYSGRTVTRFVGASDGASSTAVLLEIGRAVTKRQNDYTIELIFFDGEEAVVEWQGDDHTYGSRYYVQTAQKDGTLHTLKALVLLDMVGDRNLNIRRETTSTAWLTDVIWASARQLGYVPEFNDGLFTIGGDDHFPFLAAGIPAVDVIDFDYPHWHESTDDVQHVSQRSLQVVGEVILTALTPIEQEIASKP